MGAEASAVEEAREANGEQESAEEMGKWSQRNTGDEHHSAEGPEVRSVLRSR